MKLLPRSVDVSGSIRFAGTELLSLPEAKMRPYRGARIAMVFQDPDDALNPSMRVGRQISEVIRLHTGLDRRAAQRQAIELLRSLQMGAPERQIHAYPHELSGGMRQRVMLAVALAGNPQLLIADESTRSLDVTTQAQVVRELREMQHGRGMAVILISHDLRVAGSFADDVLVMCAGSALEYGPTRQLFERPRTPYTKALLRASCNPVAAHAPDQALAVSNEVGDTTASSGGCPFASRCPSATAPCRRERPALIDHGFGHFSACWNA
jgi:oligopeptide/dipeptide ABC transporter ATP-binding protein